MVELEYWQNRLLQHFQKLRDERRVSESGHQVFALEHGLDSEELIALTAAIRAHVEKKRPRREHFLPWITYAAEIGYRYSGGEYWQTFESETPGWIENGDRYWIRDYFYQFHKDFEGAKPRGRWAEHFAIICWPITHAILPIDLQYQLARILYDLRHTFSGEMFASPAMLGAIIKSSSFASTSRFQQLAQETDLIGQIAAALVLEGQSETGNLIYAPTLCRIARDLEKVRQAREWLRGARRAFQERAAVRGLDFSGDQSSKRVSTEQARADVITLGLEPRLILQPTDRSLTSWSVWLEIPDLSNVLLKFPQLQEILAGSPCIVAGSAGRPIARGRFLLHGPQRIQLVSWPRPEEVLLQFAQKNLQLEYLLRTECLLRPGSAWLFRIASDGLAYELRGLRVRPGEKYILVRSDGELKTNDQLASVSLACTGVSAYLLEVPEALTDGWQDLLKSLGLGQAKTIEVWPAGLAAQVWDGEGHGEWLASERPCLGIVSDHPMDSLHITLGPVSDGSLEVRSIIPGQPVYVELPQLPIGLHTVRVSSRSNRTGEIDFVGDLKVLMQIRQTRSGSRQGPLTVLMDPLTPTMEQLWEGRVAVNVYGPVGRYIKCRVSFFEKAGDNPTIIQSLNPMILPVNTEDWWERFDSDFRRAAQHKYDSARICQLDFSAEELGSFVIRCEREFVPLRWILMRRGQSHVLRLIDDSGNTNVPEVKRFSFESPASEEPLKWEKEYEVPPRGGLYIARLNMFTASIIAPPNVRTFTDLKCVPQIGKEVRSRESITRVIDLIELWSSARFPGDVVTANWQREILLSLTAHIFRLLSGDNWWKEEEAVRHGNKRQLGVLNCFISTRREHSVIVSTLLRESNSFVQATPEDRISRLAALVRPFLPRESRRVTTVSSKGKIVHQTQLPKTDDPKWLSEFALRIAVDPRGVKDWAGSELQAGLDRLLALPLLAKAARFLVIATFSPSRQSNSQRQALYPGWEWP